MVDEFGARIVKLRKARNLSQKALADRAKALDPNCACLILRWAIMKEIPLSPAFPKRLLSRMC